MYQQNVTTAADTSTTALREMEEVIIAMATLVEAAGGIRQAKQQGLFERFEHWFGRAQQMVQQDLTSDAEVVWQCLLNKASRLPLSPAARHVLEAVSQPQP